MPPDRPNQPHDGLIRTALDSLDNARTALAAALPCELLAHLDLTRLRRVPARVVDALLSARESDAVWEVPFANKDQTLLAHLVAEVQSTPDVDLVLRTLGLQVRFWEQQRRLGQRLSPVIPLVISHGATWRAPRTMLERLGMPRELESLVAPFIPTSTYVLEDLARFSPEALAARPELSVQLRVTYFLLQRSRSSAALEEELALILDDLRALSENDAARDFSPASCATLTTPPTATSAPSTACSAPTSTRGWRSKWEPSPNNSSNAASRRAAQKASKKASTKVSRRASARR